MLGLLWRAGCVMGALQLRNARAMTAGSRLPARGARGTPARHGSGRMHMWLFARALRHAWRNALRACRCRRARGPRSMWHGRGQGACAALRGGPRTLHAAAVRPGFGPPGRMGAAGVLARQGPARRCPDAPLPWRAVAPACQHPLARDAAGAGAPRRTGLRAIRRAPARHCDLPCAAVGAARMWASADLGVVCCAEMFAANQQKTTKLWMWRMEYLHHEQRPLYFGEWF